MVRGALDGVRIVEFGQLIAIPFATKLLSDMGAEVIRVESCTRLELYRASGFYDNDTSGEWWNRSVHFYEQNRNKQSLTLDLTKARGSERAAGTGFGQRRVRGELHSEGDKELRAGVRGSAEGQAGHHHGVVHGVRPHRSVERIRGNRIRDRGRVGPVISHRIQGRASGDSRNPVLRLHRRRAYGVRDHGRARSQGGDRSGAVHRHLADADAQRNRAGSADGLRFNGRTPAPSGNRDDNFPASGDVSVQGQRQLDLHTIRSDSEWESLCSVLGRDEWTRDIRFADRMARRQNHDLIDDLIADSTRNRDSEELQSALQAVGVPAGAALDGKALLFNEHLAERGFYEVVEHPADLGMPPLPYPSRPWKFSGTPGTIRSAAPKLGEHNRAVLADVLGMSEDRVGALEESGVIGTRPVNTRAPSQPTNEMLKQQGLIVRREPDFKEQVRERFG